MEPIFPIYHLARGHLDNLVRVHIRQICSRKWKIFGIVMSATPEFLLLTLLSMSDLTVQQHLRDTFRRRRKNYLEYPKSG